MENDRLCPLLDDREVLDRETMAGDETLGSVQGVEQGHIQELDIGLHQDLGQDQIASPDQGLDLQNPEVVLRRCYERP